MSIKVENLYVNYGKKSVVKNVNFEINPGEVVSFIGPNGSGKSTILKVISRCIKCDRGKILLYGTDINSIPSKTVARKMAILPQVKNTPLDITVEEFVGYGRYPHMKFRKKLSSKDNEIICWAIEKTGLKTMMDRRVDTLSGGEIQRAWIAMALCQKPEILILDEPTTYLDIQYQLEILEIIKHLNQNLNMTIIMVLHDLNQAARYSSKIFVVYKGMLWNSGSPKDVINKKLFNDVFNINADIYEDKVNKCPYFIPKV